ncbi:hypothetical protein H5410_008591 [Solanum commersonii]|uniref:F-box domain-containing protein n=1 Tax=Solanum commersonii TaxID=4109 RepID=A0A9J6AFE1_SOLCO|nr:hypothetical protein H5410_008591 [Solanum commersonii]
MTRSFDEKKSVHTCKEESFAIKQSKKRKRHRHAIRIHLSDETTTNILSRLSVQSLLRFKCISKFWNTLISDPYFNMKHQSHNSEKLLVGQWCMDTPNIFNFYASRLSSVQLVEDDVKKLVSPSNYKPAIRDRVYSSCNGLVLLSIAEDLLIWNPSARESIRIPHLERQSTFLTYGFGYDTINNDYNILKLNYPNMEILPLKSGLWRKISYCGRDLLPILCNALMDPLTFLHGAFHWVGNFQEKKLFVVSFSISNETYGEIQLLEPMRKIFTHHDVKYGVAILREMLCVYYGENTTCKL